MQSSADVLKADQATIQRAKVLVPFGLTERQAGFLATVMLHSGVFVGRQYAAFAGITHGRRVHDFIEKLLTRRLVTAIELGSTGRTRIFHVHHKPLYAAIGEPDNRNRRRVTIDRVIERLMMLDGVLADRSVTWLGSERKKLLKAPKNEASFHDLDEFERSWTRLGLRFWPSWSFCSVARQGCDAARSWRSKWSDIDFAKRQLTVARSEWKGHVTLPKGGGYGTCR